MVCPRLTSRELHGDGDTWSFVTAEDSVTVTRHLWSRRSDGCNLHGSLKNYPELSIHYTGSALGFVYVGELLNKGISQKNRAVTHQNEVQSRNDPRVFGKNIAIP